MSLQPWKNSKNTKTSGNEQCSYLIIIVATSCHKLEMDNQYRSINFGVRASAALLWLILAFCVGYRLEFSVMQ